MENFATLKPAFKIRFQTAPAEIIGKSFSGGHLFNGPIDHGTIESVPGYGPSPFRGTVGTGSDLFVLEPSLESVKLDYRGTFKTEDDEWVFFAFTGYIAGNEKTWPLMKLEKDAKGAPWGSTFISGHFETGSEKWKGLNRKIFVGSENLSFEGDKPVIVEINVSEVTL